MDKGNDSHKAQSHEEYSTKNSVFGLIKLGP